MLETYGLAYRLICDFRLLNDRGVVRIGGVILIELKPLESSYSTTARTYRPAGLPLIVSAGMD